MALSAIRIIVVSLFLLKPAYGSLWSTLNPELSKIDQASAALLKAIEPLPPFPEPQLLEPVGFHSALTSSPSSMSWVQVDLGTEQELESVVIIPAFLGTPQQAAGVYGFPDRYRVDLCSEPTFLDPLNVLDRTDSDVLQSMGPIHIPISRHKARYIRFTATRLKQDPASKRFFFCLGELLAFSNGANVACHRNITASSMVLSHPTWSTVNLVDGASALGFPVSVASNSNNGWRSDVASSATTEKWVQVDLGASLPLQEIRLFPAHPTFFPERKAFGFPARFKVEASETEDFNAPIPVFQSTRKDYPNPGDNPVSLPTSGITARYLRVTATQLSERTNDYVFALAELEIYSGGKNVALGKSVTALDDAQNNPTWKREALTDGLLSTGQLVDWNLWLQKLSQHREFKERLAQLEREKTHATAVAERRASLLAFSIGALFCCGVGLTFWRHRQKQRMELHHLREQIARDLHDDLGSHLGSIRLMSELAVRNTSGDNGEVLQEIQRLSSEAAESMHAIVWLMRETGAPSLGRLVEAIRQSAASLLAETSLEISQSGENPEQTASLHFHRQILLLVRESLYNIARHARATTVQIKVKWTSSTFYLDIGDNGCGFDIQARGTGNGLRNLHQRTATLNGKIAIQSAPGQGTQIAIEAPLL